MKDNTGVRKKRDADAPTTISVIRTMTVLELLSQHQNMQLEELAERSDIARPTLYRFLATLQQLEYVHKDRDNRYSLTTKLFSVASRSLDQVELSRIARPYLEVLTNESGETSFLGILDGDEALHISKIMSKFHQGPYERIGKKVPLYCTAMGKVLLAGMDPVQKSEYYEHVRLEPYSGNTIRSIEVLKREIERVAEQGYAVNDREYQDNAKSLSVPVYDRDHTVIAAITMSWPMYRDEPRKVELFLEMLRKAALEISITMGHVG